MRTYFSILYTSRVRRIIDPKYKLNNPMFLKYLKFRRRMGLDIKNNHIVSMKHVKYEGRKIEIVKRISFK